MRYSKGSHKLAHQEIYAPSYHDFAHMRTNIDEFIEQCEEAKKVSMVIFQTRPESAGDWSYFTAIVQGTIWKWTDTNCDAGSREHGEGAEGFS